MPMINETPFFAATRFESKAVFGNVDFDLDQLITLHAGARYTHTGNDYKGCFLNAGNNVLGLGLARIFGFPASSVVTGQCTSIIHPTPTSRAFGLVTGTLPEHNVSWRLGVDLKPAPGQLVYVNASRGFKAGTFTNIGGTDSAQNVPAKQEELTAYEVGFKSSLLDRKLQLNGALFYYDYVNKQLRGRMLVPIFSYLEALINIPKSRVKGAELQAVVAPVAGLRVSLSGVYVDSKITKSYSNFTQFGQRVDFKGSPFPYTPKWQLNGDVDYNWQISSQLTAFVGANVSYRSSTTGDFKPDPRVAVDPYTLLDLRAGFEDVNKRWRVNFYGRNVTNKYYWTTATRRGDTIVRFAGMPVTYGIDLTLNFR